MKPEPRRILHIQPNPWARLEEISDTTDDRERSWVRGKCLESRQLANLYSQADLGRHRQEELPLSNEQRKGPSYDPLGSRTHYNKVSVKKAKEASTAWSSKHIPSNTSQSGSEAYSRRLHYQR